MNLIRQFKLNNCPPDYVFNQLPFGRQIEHYKKFDDFKLKHEVKTDYLSIKHKANAKKEIKRFLDSVEPKEYYLTYYDEENYRDDSIKIWYLK